MTAIIMFLISDVTHAKSELRDNLNKLSSQEINSPTKKLFSNNDNLAATGLSCNSTGLNCTVLAISNFYPSFGGSRLVVFNTVDGGVTWSSPIYLSKPAHDGLNNAIISCDKNTNQNCVVRANYEGGNDNVFSSNDGGHSWSKGDKSKITVYSEICDDDAYSCIANSNVGLIKKDSFYETFFQHVTDDLLNRYKFACNGSLDQCLIVNPHLIASDEGYTMSGFSISGEYGNSKSTLTTIPSFDSKTSAEIVNGYCDQATGLQCLLTGTKRENWWSFSQPFVVTTSDGGQTWNPIIHLKNLDETDGTVPSVMACSASAQHCVVITNTFGCCVVGPDDKSYSYTTDNGGLTWSDPKVFSTFYIDQLSCDKEGNHCLAIGRNLGQALLYYISENGGENWKGPMKLQ